MHGTASNTNADVVEALRAGTLDGVRTMRDLPSVLADPAARTRAERALMALPEFAALYRGRLRPPPAPDDTLADDSLGALHHGFQTWYGLTPEFFPVAYVAEAGPLAFAAILLARDHDVYHVLCEYETSDRDEVALQSFLCGQSPCVLACFIETIAACPRLSAPSFKHLRDLLDSDLDREALARGRAAKPLTTIDLDAHRKAPAAALREQLAIPPRRAPSAHTLRNTCDGKQADPYFVTARVRHAN